MNSREQHGCSHQYTLIKISQGFQASLGGFDLLQPRLMGFHLDFTALSGLWQLWYLHLFNTGGAFQVGVQASIIHMFSGKKKFMLIFQYSPLVIFQYSPSIQFFMQFIKINLMWVEKLVWITPNYEHCYSCGQKVKRTQKDISMTISSSGQASTA